MRSAAWGLTWVSVGSGAEALVHCTDTDPARTSFDVVLSDCDMPDMNGIHLTTQIRSGDDSANRGPSVVLMLTDQRDRARAKRAGADLLVAKPVQREPLHAALEQALSRAVALYREPVAWRRVMLRGMAQDNSWTGAAASYIELYQQAVKARDAAPRTLASA